MKITLLVSDTAHPVYSFLERWRQGQGGLHEIEIKQRAEDAVGGDFLFLISCSEIIGPDIRARYKHSLVVHASDLPQGRGWSPHIWQILAGQKTIMVSLLEAEDKVDSGRIWLQKPLQFEGHELYDEINDRLFATTAALISEAIKGADTIAPRAQEGESSYYEKRKPGDSRIDPAQSIESQFNLLRVADPDRYPAFFDHAGHRYAIHLRKVK